MTPASPLKIPVLNLQRQYDQVGHQIEESVLEVLRSGEYVLGKRVTEIENKIAQISGCKYGIGVANGTDALELALWGLDIGEGDEVITPTFTFAATVVAIALCGAKPVFTEIIPETFNIDPASIEQLITPRTKAILPVHLYGQTANMEPIMKIAQKHNLKVIEDSAQAIGALYKGHPAGSFGNLTTISFYPTKNIGAAGDGGMIVTNDSVLAERLKALRVYGMRTRYYHDELGVNSRLDELQAAVLLAKAPFLEQWNEKRREVAGWYDELLKNCPNLICPTIASRHTHIWHQYTVRIVGSAETNGALRNSVKEQLADAGIGSMIYYPVPLHLQKAFAHLGGKIGDYPISENVAHEVLSLPIYPELTHDEVAYVADSLHKIMSGTQSVSTKAAVAGARNG